jgi:benzodiazapine receptor
MKKIHLLQGLVIVGVVLTLLVNYLATAGMLNDVTPPEISDALLTKFTPANYAFSIWGIIYTFVIGFAIYQASPSQRDNPKLAGVRELFIASCGLNILWTFAWHYEFYSLSLSLILMVGILLTMIGIHVRAGIGKPANGWGERLWVHLPFSLYLSWIAVATIANAASLFAYYGWSAFGVSDSLWSAIMILIAAMVGAAVLWRRANAAYAAVYVWAVFAITVRYANETPITVAAYAGIVIVVAAATRGWLRFVKDGGNRPMDPA